MKKFIVSLLFLGVAGNAFSSGIPTVDVASIVQETISAQEAMAHTLKQIEQYKLQLEQYQNMVQNTKSLSNFDWAQVENIFDELNASQQSLNSLANQQNQIYKNIGYYDKVNCGTNCPDAYYQHQIKTSSHQLQTMSDAVRTVEWQRMDAKYDAKRVKNIMRHANNASGQMEALQAANEFAAAQIDQTMKLNMLMRDFVQSTVARQQAQVDREAANEAATKDYINSGSSLGKTGAPLQIKRFNK